MALRYVIKKRTFGFDKTKAEKYVAQNVITIRWISEICARKSLKSEWFPVER